MYLPALSNSELANLAEADQRYLTDPMFTELVHRLQDDKQTAELNAYDATSEKRALIALIGDGVNEAVVINGDVIERALEIIDEVADNATPLVSELPLLYPVPIIGPVVRVT